MIRTYYLYFSLHSLQIYLLKKLRPSKFMTLVNLTFLVDAQR
ncbi:hypothetical protein ES703_15482 [subsurface metagenome]